jgi:beta-glucosidase/6-phospho-beta-glucosidase/beta-galactosidase
VETVDLKYYDQLIDALCANGIAVLGLLDYQLLVDDSWKREGGNGVISDDYLDNFKRRVTLLTSDYGDRIKAWEVWNEPASPPV